MLVSPQLLATYLYLRQGEQMPADAEDSWFLEPDPFSVDQERLERFIVRTEQLLLELEQLELDPAELAPPQYMTLFYEAAKDVFDQDKSLLRQYFVWLYLIVFQRDEGPRWGEFVQVYGVEEFNRLVRERFANLL